MFIANIYVGLQFCGKAALKRRITLSYQYRASEASEEKIHVVCVCVCFFFFPKKILILRLIVKFANLLVSNQYFSLLLDIFYGLNR